MEADGGGGGGGDLACVLDRHLAVFGVLHYVSVLLWEVDKQVGSHSFSSGSWEEMLFPGLRLVCLELARYEEQVHNPYESGVSTYEVINDHATKRRAMHEVYCR